MEPSQKRVLEFHRAFGQPAPEKFTPLRDPKLLELRCKLILEEALEFCAAAGYYITVNHPDDNYATCIGDVDLVRMDGIDPDDVEMADALGDIIYVTYGAAVCMGLDLAPVETEIHRSNMSKLQANGQPLLRDDGKVLKSNLYSPPDIERALRASALQHFIDCGPFCEHTQVCSACSNVYGICADHVNDPSHGVSWR